MSNAVAEYALFLATIVAAAVLGWRFPWLLEVSGNGGGREERRAYAGPAGLRRRL